MDYEKQRKWLANSDSTKLKLQQCTEIQDALRCVKFAGRIIRKVEEIASGLDKHFDFPKEIARGCAILGFLAGRTIGEARVLTASPLVGEGAATHHRRSQGGAGTAKLSDEEWDLVIARRKELARTSNATRAAEEIAQQLGYGPISWHKTASKS